MASSGPGWPLCSVPATSAGPAPGTPGIGPRQQDPWQLGGDKEGSGSILPLPSPIGAPAGPLHSLWDLSFSSAGTVAHAPSALPGAPCFEPMHGDAVCWAPAQVLGAALVVCDLLCPPGPCPPSLQTWETCVTRVEAQSPPVGVPRCSTRAVRDPEAMRSCGTPEPIGPASSPSSGRPEGGGGGVRGVRSAFQGEGSVSLRQSTGCACALPGRACQEGRQEEQVVVLWGRQT